MCWWIHLNNPQKKCLPQWKCLLQKNRPLPKKCLQPCLLQSQPPRSLQQLQKSQQVCKVYRARYSKFSRAGTPASNKVLVILKLNSYSIASIFYRFVECLFFEVTVHGLQFKAHDLKKRTCDKEIKKRMRSSMNSALNYSAGVQAWVLINSFLKCGFKIVGLT